MGWKAAKDYDPAAYAIVSCGILIKEDDKFITLAMDHSVNDDTYNGWGSIPKGCVDSRADIQVDIEGAKDDKEGKDSKGK